MSVDFAEVIFSRGLDIALIFVILPHGLDITFIFSIHVELLQDTAAKPNIKKSSVAKPNIKKSSGSYSS